MILGLVEGLTEFIPVSSTGHLIIVGHFLGFEGEVAQTFEIFIQLGAVLAVLLLYWRKFLDPAILKLLCITTLPALFFGALFHSFIKTHLFNPVTVCLGLFAGGAVMIGIEKILLRPGKEGIHQFKVRDAVWVGLFQCLAMWPGVSRSAATIVGGMALGYSRKTAAEYSFLAAVPVIFAATAYDLMKSWEFLSLKDAPQFAGGFLVSFISAAIAVKWLIHYLSNHPLSIFGWYRVAIAPIVFIFAR